VGGTRFGGLWAAPSFDIFFMIYFFGFDKIDNHEQFS
jgi:hypothetical protein